MLTGIGMRKCFLIYRVYPSFQTQEVQEHAMTVAKNLYGGLADQYVLGVYRADEDNAVRKNDPSFAEALMNIDSAGIRRELLSSILNDVLARAEELLEQAKISNTALGLYLDALQTAQSHCVRQALSHFPVDRVTKHFVDIWLSTDPPFIKAMRRTGHLIELPFKIASRTAKTIKDAFAGREKALDQENFGDAIKEDLLSAVNRMRYHTLNPQISVLAALKDPVTRRMSNAVDRIRAGKVLKRQKIPRKEVEQGKGVLKFIVPVHPVVFPQQEAMKCLDWKSIQESILSQQEVISEFSVDIEKDLEDLANQNSSDVRLSFKRGAGYRSHYLHPLDRRSCRSRRNQGQAHRAFRAA